MRVNMWAHQPSRLTERNLGQNLCNLGQYVRLNVGSHLHMHMCPSPTPPHEVNQAKIINMSKLAMLVFVLVLVFYYTMY